MCKISRSLEIRPKVHCLDNIQNAFFQHFEKNIEVRFKAQSSLVIGSRCTYCRAYLYIACFPVGFRKL